LVIIIWPGKVGLIWGADGEFLHWCREMLPIGFYTCWTGGYQSTGGSLLQALHYAGVASGLAILTGLLSSPLFSAMLYFTGKNDPARIMWAYVMNDVFSVIVTTLFLIKPLKMLKAGSEEENEEDKKKVMLEMGLTDGEETAPGIISVSLVV
jgi:hypothetical protein